MIPEEHGRVKHFTYLHPKDRHQRKTNVIELAGVKFRIPSKQICLFDIHFSNGVLKIPYFEIDDSKESLIRDLMVLLALYTLFSSLSISLIFLIF